ncbi:MAG: hypothetical protein GY797_00855 [Deltaproteobacteria bacterium]|nr:hypothetical protein [Deltaproteobacteria bacterium]
MKKINIYLIIILVGLFLGSCNNGDVAKREKVVTRLLPDFGENGGMIPDSLHPLSEKINQFLSVSNQPQDFKATGLDKNGYIKIIEGQVRAMKQYQNNEGRIIDPVDNVEKYYSTPCYAHSVAALVASSCIDKDDQLAISGMKALDVSLTDMANATVKENHGDFYTWPAMFAYECFKPFVSEERLKSWDNKLQSIKIDELYKAYNFTYGNWALVHTAGEFLRNINGFTSIDYVESMVGGQLPNFTELGMYNERGNPLPYDLFSRHYMCGMLNRNYNGKYYSVLRDVLWKGAWMSLFMQSPFGELPTGYRSSHHIWNEAEQCVIFEIYAAEYAKMGYEKEAGVFKRAAMLSLGSISNWIREDGSGYIVKNRYPKESKHAYEVYSVHTCYNMLACSMLAQAWQFANNSIAEKPAPADVGGFVVPILTPFHKIFANANGTYLEYDTNGDQKYNPTGILRMHIKGGNPQLGPSDGAAPNYSGEGVSIATGLSWQNADGTWSSLAEQKVVPSKVEVLEETTNSVKFKIDYSFPEASKLVTISETIGIKDGIITVENEISGVDGLKRINWPMLVFDGQKNVNVEMTNSSAELELNGTGVKFTILNNSGSKLKRSNEKLIHRNGLVETAFAEFNGNKISYQLTAK